MTKFFAFGLSRFGISRTESNWATHTALLLALLLISVYGIASAIKDR